MHGESGEAVTRRMAAGTFAMPLPLGSDTIRRNALRLLRELSTMPQVGFDLLRRFEAADDALVLRRYVPDWKFADLVSSKALFVAPASKFSDKLEGHYTHLDNERSDRQLVQWGFDSRARDIAEDARTRIESHNQKAVLISVEVQESGCYLLLDGRMR